MTDRVRCRHPIGDLIRAALPWGTRARMLARFVSPQVTELVSRRGPYCATESETLEVSVVCCDLRGFTAFSESTSSREVLELLREFYDCVGSAAEEHGGTIKDQAGDGALILVGAPVCFPDHARRALLIARRIRRSGVELSQRWSLGRAAIGVGVGVASGRVTAGVIGARSRLEYTAVGSAVNRASRLCSAARHGELLLDERTIDELDACTRYAEPRAGRMLHLKGIQSPVQTYSVEES